MRKLLQLRMSVASKQLHVSTVNGGYGDVTLSRAHSCLRFYRYNHCFVTIITTGRGGGGVENYLYQQKLPPTVFEVDVVGGGGAWEDGNTGERYECHDMLSGCCVLWWNCKFCGCCCRSKGPPVSVEGRRRRLRISSSSWTALDLTFLRCWFDGEPIEGLVVGGEFTEIGEFESFDGGRLLFTNPFRG